MRNLTAFKGLRFGRLGSLLSSTPLAFLFASQEPGVWLDPSDLTTLFQDSAGTTPVTAPGQSVGLVLDKSKGLGLGPELAPSGGKFDSTTGYTTTVNSSISGGRLNFTGALIGEIVVADTNMVAGKRYLISYTVVSISGELRLRAGHTGDVTAGVVAAGTYSYVLLAGGDGDLQIQTRNTTTGAIDNISVRELPGNHATQPTAAARPTYQVDSNGRGYLSFDGVDDFLVTPTITPGIDKVQVFAGVRKLSDAVSGNALELSASALDNPGTFLVRAPQGAAPNYSWFSRGNGSLVQASASSYSAPITNVLTGIGDISGDLATIRVNGTQAAQNTADQGTGNFNAYPMYIGRRGGTSLPFNGRIYGLIVRFGTNLNESQIKQVESLLAQKTGVTL